MKSLSIVRTVVFLVICVLLMSAEFFPTEKPLLIGLPCKWEDLTAKEQKKAGKLGYKEADTVWKTSNSKGAFELPAGTLTITAMKIDGVLKLVVKPAGLFVLAPPSQVENTPPIIITHVMIDGLTHDMTLRCLQKWDSLSDSDKKTALEKGYQEGEDIILYADGKVLKVTIEPPPRN